MFGLSLVVLGLFASLIYLNDIDQEAVIVRWCLVGLAVAYPLFWLETAVHLYHGSPFMKQHLWFCLLPITRVGARDHETGQEIWLPRLGWREVNRPLERMLTRRFSIPMIAIALMVLPVIALELFYKDFVESAPGWRIAMSVAEAFIWAAFTFEFVLMTKIVRSKLTYARKHWLDLAVILLPMLAFMRMMRLASVGRLNQLSRTAKIFRLRGLGMRLWRAFVALEIIELLIARDPERRLARLEDELESRLEEVAWLRQDICRLRERVGRSRATGELPLASGQADGDTSTEQPSPVPVAGEDAAGTGSDEPRDDADGVLQSA
jgi:voltage-gated potassium channel